MFQRRIPVSAVETVVAHPAAVIEEYPDDEPFPSRLLLGWHQGEALHVHVAVDTVSETAIVVTLYKPDPERWELDFVTRKS